MTKMASSSRVFLADAELVQVLETLDSDLSDISDCDDAVYIPEDSSDSEVEENDSMPLTIESPVEPLTSVLPLIFVIAVTALKQGYEDWLRHRADNEVNCSLVTVIRKGIVQDIKAKDVRVGDLVRIVSDAEVPCDLVLLSSSDRDGRCYVTTANLDGETNLKTLVCPRLLRNFSEPEQLARLKAQIECEQPTPDLYNFYGKIELLHNKVSTYANLQNGHCDSVFENTKSSPLGTEHLLLRGARLKNTEFVIGCAVYTGQETKLALNSKLTSNKFSTVEKMRNFDHVFEQENRRNIARRRR
ncbi:hypothetical protein L9F63_005777, partial [Diploptera punctata]